MKTIITVVAAVAILLGGAACESTSSNTSDTPQIKTSGDGGRGMGPGAGTR